MKILSTKLLDSSTIDHAKNLGADLTCIEFIKTHVVDLDRSLLSSDRFNALVFTSSNAVRSVFENNEDISFSKPVYAASGKTNDELLKYGVTPKAVADDAAKLADIIVAQNRITSVLHVCGDIALDTLQQKLKRAIILYTRLIVYKTVILDVKVNGEYDAVMFFSPSGVDGFLKNNVADGNATYCCIGGTTAEYLKSKQHELDILVSPIPTPEVMIEIIMNNRNRK